MDPNTGANPTLPATVSPPRGYVLSGKLMLSGIVVLFAIVIFILFLHIYVRWHVLRRYDRRRRRRNRLLFATAAADDQNHHNPSAPRGLDKEVLNSLSVEVFSDEDADAETEAECAVCINEFDEGEKVRVLPRCGHRFHVDCIDMWFCSHSTCPLCRCAVEASAAQPTPATEDSAAAAAASSDLEVPVPDPRIEEVRIEIPPEESGSTSTEVVPVKLPGHRRMSSLRRFLIGIQIANPDVERGEPLDRSPLPPPPPPPATTQ